MATGTTTIQAKSTVQTAQTGFLSGKRGRKLKENLSAYLFLLPSMSLIFIFGIFPVAFSLYVSMYRWKIKQTAFKGLENYTKAMGNLAYVIAFILAFGAIVLAGWFLVKVWKSAKEANEKPWLLCVPGFLLALTVYQFIVYFVLVLPEILSIGEKVQRVVRTRELYVQLFKEAFQVEAVAQAQQQFIVLAIATVVALVVVNRFIKTRQNGQYINWFFLSLFFTLIGFKIAQFTYSSISAIYLAAQESGDEVLIWPEVYSVLAGLAALYFSWIVWQSASKRASGLKMGLTLLAAIFLLVGAWVLLVVMPPIIASGDKDMWSGLRVTAWYSFLTVPVQLMLGLGIAYLLYQNIRGKSFFRMIYFLPYITPVVAAAAVFRVIFSNRPTGMANSVLSFIGAEPLNWLLEPNSVFNIGKLEGPSLALLVIILFNIWVFAGYNAVIYLAGLGGIPQSLYEAAEIDGANRWQLFKNITWPLLSPITYFLSLLGVIGTFKAFTHIFVLRNPAALRSVDTMSMVIWDLLKTDNRYGYSATMAFVLFGVVLVLTLINNSVQGKKVFYG